MFKSFKLFSCTCWKLTKRLCDIWRFPESRLQTLCVRFMRIRKISKNAVQVQVASQLKYSGHWQVFKLDFMYPISRASALLPSDSDLKSCTTPNLVNLIDYYSQLLWHYIWYALVWMKFSDIALQNTGPVSSGDQITSWSVASSLDRAMDRAIVENVDHPRLSHINPTALISLWSRNLG